MFGIIIGTACLIGLIKVLRRGWYGHGGYGYGHDGPGFGGFGGFGGGCGGGGGDWAGRSRGWGGGPFGFAGGAPWESGGGRWGGRWGGPDFFLRQIFEHLDATPGQEKVMREAASELRAEAAKHREELHKTRADIAKAMRSESFDEVLLGELFARHDSALESLRKATTGALARVHVVLDERQRARLADLIELGPGAFRRRPSHRDAL